MMTDAMDQERMDMRFTQLSMPRSTIAAIAPEDRELTVIDDMMPCCCRTINLIEE